MQKFLFLVPFLTLFIIVAKSEEYKVTISRVECSKCDSRLLYDNCTCFTKFLARNQKVFTIQGTTLPEVLLNDVFIHIKTFAKFGAIYRPMVLDVEEDVCRFLNKTSRSILLSILWPEIAAVSNLNHTCPFSGNFIIKDFDVSKLKFPPLGALQRNDFRVDIHLKNGKERISIIKIQGYGSLIYA